MDNAGFPALSQRSESTSSAEFLEKGPGSSSRYKILRLEIFFVFIKI